MFHGKVFSIVSGDNDLPALSAISNLFAEYLTPARIASEEIATIGFWRSISFRMLVFPQRGEPPIMYKLFMAIGHSDLEG